LVHRCGLLHHARETAGMDAKYLRVEELARATRLPAAWLKREADQGRLPCIRAGRLRMFDLAAVLKALAERQESGAGRAK
jgi:hypothetical protein